jgi:hypothetical protein
MNSVFVLYTGIGNLDCLNYTIVLFHSPILVSRGFYSMIESFSNIPNSLTSFTDQ